MIAANYCLSDLDCPNNVCDPPKASKCGWYYCSCAYE